MTSLRLAVKQVGEPVEVQEHVVNSTNDILGLIQKLVGGYVEEYRLSKDVIILLNEDGIARGLSPNCGFLGNLVFVQLVANEDGEVDWGSISNENIRKVFAWCEQHAFDLADRVGNIEIITGDENIARHRARLAASRQARYAEWESL